MAWREAKRGLFIHQPEGTFRWGSWDSKAVLFQFALQYFSSIDVNINILKKQDGPDYYYGTTCVTIGTLLGQKNCSGLFPLCLCLRRLQGIALSEECIKMAVAIESSLSEIPINDQYYQPRFHVYTRQSKMALIVVLHVYPVLMVVSFHLHRGPALFLCHNCAMSDTNSPLHNMHRFTVALSFAPCLQ